MIASINCRRVCTTLSRTTGCYRGEQATAAITWREPNAAPPKARVSSLVCKGREKSRPLLYVLSWRGLVRCCRRPGDAIYDRGVREYSTGTVSRTRSRCGGRGCEGTVGGEATRESPISQFTALASSPSWLSALVTKGSA